MGFTPAEIDQMTVWEFMACSKGYVAAHGGKEKPGLGDMEDHELRGLGIEGF